MDLVGFAGGDAAVGCGRATEPLVASWVVGSDKSRGHEVIDMRLNGGAQGGDAAVGCGRATEPLVASWVVGRDKSRGHGVIDTRMGLVVGRDKSRGHGVNDMRLDSVEAHGGRAAVACGRVVMRPSP